jgi:hypothetical protein
LATSVPEVLLSKPGLLANLSVDAGIQLDPEVFEALRQVPTA